MARTCTLLDLPDELLAHIAQAVSDQRDLIGLLCLRISCKRLRTLSCSAFQPALQTRAQLFTDTVVFTIRSRQYMAELQLCLLQLWPGHHGERRSLLKDAILALKRETAHCLTSLHRYERWEARTQVHSWKHMVQCRSADFWQSQDPAQVRQAVQQHLWDLEECAARAVTPCHICFEKCEGCRDIFVDHTMRDYHDYDLCEFLGRSAAGVEDLWDDLSSICASIDHDLYSRPPHHAHSFRRHYRSPAQAVLKAKSARTWQCR